MSAFDLVCDGALLAAELVALVFTPAATGTYTAQPERELHARARSADITLLGPLSNARLAQAVRHDGEGELRAVDDEDCDVREPGPLDGHARLTADEQRADLLPRPAQARLLPGSTPRLAIVPPPGMRGFATLTVRPSHGATQVVTLGRLTSSLVIVPIAAPMTERQLAEGAIELETVEAGRVVWTTLSFVPSTAFVSAIAAH
jgi:hypothetical protein